MMLHIRKSDFDRLRREHPDYIGRCLITHEHNGVECRRGEWMAFEGALTGDWSKGTVLIFQHIHFEIV